MRRLGYIRTSTDTQITARQVMQLEDNCDQVFIEDGVCLPSSASVASNRQTDAFVHSGNVGLLHDDAIVGRLLNACQNMNSSQFRDYLRQTAEGFTRGVFIP